MNKARPDRSYLFVCAWFLAIPILFVTFLTVGIMDRIKEDRDIARYEVPADRDFSQGNYQAAAQLYGVYLSREPQTLEVKYKLGLTYLKLGEKLMARKYFLMALRDQGVLPYSPEGHRFILSCQAQIDAIDKSESSQ